MLGGRKWLQNCPTNALLDENPSPTEEEALQAISGNVCRCTGYAKIVEVMLKAAEMIQGGGHE